MFVNRLLLRHPLMSPADPPPGGGGPVPPVPPVPSVVPPVPPVPPAPPAEPDVKTLAAQLTALQAKLDAAETEKAAVLKTAADAAEATRVKGLSDKQLMDEELAKQRGEIEATKKGLVTDRRNLALDRFGLLEKFRPYAPDVDPGTPEGAKALEAWVKVNPELCRAVNNGGQPTITDRITDLAKTGSTALQDVLSGKRKSTLVSAESATKLLGG